MFRPVSRTGVRAAQSSISTVRNTTGRRFITTQPPHRVSRSWKNSALRWGIAVGGLYYYNTSPVFAEKPENNLLNPNVEALDDDSTQSPLDLLTASSRNKAEKNKSVLQSAVETTSAQNANTDSSPSQTGSDVVADVPMGGSPADLEEEAASEGAFNPVTGEINWDCPCLGGMAHGPCGPEFREAFSCFVYSTEEPKGMNCIDKFQSMQTCFKAHPEVYKGELEDDEELDEGFAEEKQQLQKEIAERKAAAQETQSQRRLLDEPEKGGAPAQKDETKSKPSSSEPQSSIKKTASKGQGESAPQSEHKRSTTGYQDKPEQGQSSSPIREAKAPEVADDATPESESLVPKAAYDATN